MAIVRSFTIQEVAALSELSRGQIDQFISRWGFGAYGRAPLGRARAFHAADVFNFMLAGELHRLGVSMPNIRELVLGHLGMYRWSPDTEAPAEIYPGQGGLDSVPDGHFIALFHWDDRYQRRLLVGATSPKAAPAGRAAILIDASSMARRIVELACQERFE